MKYHLPSILASALCLLAALTVNGQKSVERYNFVTIDENFPKSAITTIIQDQTGLIWIATYGEGLYQYNGTDLKVYRHKANDSTSLNSSIIHTVFLDSKHQLWVGTEQGLHIYDKTFDNFKEVKLFTPQSKQENLPIFSIGENSSGSIFIGTPSHGLFKINSTEFTIEKVGNELQLSEPNAVFSCMVPLDNGDMLIGTNKGLFIYDHIRNLLRSKSFVTLNGPKEINYSIQSLFLDNNKNLLIGTFNQGLLRIGEIDEGLYDYENFKFTDKRIFDIEMVDDHTIICATENDGLFVLNEDGMPVHNYKYDKSDPNRIRSNSIWSVFIDDQQRIWLGYYNKGIEVYDELHDKFSDLSSLPFSTNSLQSPSVTGIVQDSDEFIWIAMDGGGIDKYNPYTKTFQHLNEPTGHGITGLEKTDIITIFLDSQENIWAGTWSAGIYFLAKNSKTFVNYNINNTDGQLKSNSVTNFSESSDGTIWVATYFGGLHSYNPETKEFENHPNKSFNNSLGNEKHIRTILVDHNDHIWLGTPKGLFKTYLNKENEYLTIALNSYLLNESDSDSSLNTRSLFEDSDHNVWAGTYGKGLFKIDKNLTNIEWYTEKDGLLLKNITAIIEDNNKDIWVSGDTGLAKLNLETKSFSNYNIEDGLLANNFNYNAVAKDKNGLLYFGNYEGIDYFDPSTIIRNENVPTVYFTDFKLFNKSVEPGIKDSPLEKTISEIERLILKPKDYAFTLEFAAINFTRANNNKYAYYLEGFEENWNYVGNNRSATYTNLSPGEYTFHVKASNNDGVWTADNLSLPITVLAPWWATKWAILSYLLLFITISFFINRFINNRIEEKRILKFERAQREQEEMLNERKIQFFTNISHEFRTPLTLILNPLLDIIDTNQYKLSKGLKEKHRIIYRNAQRLKNLIDEIMDFRKINLNKLTLNVSHINAYKFVKEITEHFEDEAFEKNILLSTEADDDQTDFWGDPGLLEKVIFNLLSNAFKATSENGVISIGIYSSKKNIILPLIDEFQPVKVLEITIEDTGKGISKDDIDHIFERFYRAKDRNQQYYGGSGTGIGLELVQSFVELHKGKVEVESKEGEGTKFSLFFPLGKEHLKSSEYSLSPPQDDQKTVEFSASLDDLLNEEANDTRKEFSLNDKIKKTILIVEDNIELRNYLKNKLRLDYSVVEAENGKDGLQMALKGIPDIIITDIIMPEMDGFEFCKKIKEDLKTSHIPVLMLTAKAMSSDKVKGIDSGADAYLNKPFEMKLLRSYLKRLIESRQQFLEKNINDKNKITLLENTTSIDKTFMQKVLDYINENIAETNLNVEHLADDMSLSRSQLYRKIKAITGMTASELIRKIRLERAKQMIENGVESISEIGFKVGFSSPSYFSKCFKNEFGMLPTEMKTSS